MIETDVAPAPDPELAAIAAEAETYARANPHAEREARHLAALREMQEEDREYRRLLMLAAQRDERLRARAEANEDVPPPSRLETIVRVRSSLVRATRQLMLLEMQIETGRWERHAEIVHELVSAKKRKDASAANWANIHDLCTGEQLTAVREVMEPMIEDVVGDDEDRADVLLKGLDQALHAASELEGFTERCVGEVTADLCQTLGLTPDWDDWAHTEWARTEAELKIEGSPFCPEPRVYEDADGRWGFSAVRARKTGPP